MKPKSSLTTFVLLGISFIIGIALVFSANARSRSSNNGVGSNVEQLSFPQPPASCKYCNSRLLTASLQEIGKFAQQYLANNGYVQSGTPQVLLTRVVNRSGLAKLGLACVGNSSTLEEAPWVLVILKGDFASGNVLSSQSALNQPQKGTGYAAAVFDIWAADMTYWKFSKNGAHFRLALNDPTLPGTGPSAPLVCPTDIPAPKTQHYGDFAPAFPQPTLTTTAAPAFPSSTLPVPPPVPTSIP